MKPKTIGITACIIFYSLFCVRPIFAQTSPTFSVEGEVLQTLQLSLQELSEMQQTEVTAHDRDGKAHTFKGVTLFEILKKAGVTLGKELRGENLTKYVLISAVDGYEIIYSLPELDPEFTDQTVIMAYEIDGEALPSGEGPFRVIAPQDKKQARWIREVSTVKVLFSTE